MFSGPMLAQPSLPFEPLVERSGAGERQQLSYLTVEKFRVVVETRRNRHRIVRNRGVSVCGYRAGSFGLGLAQLWAQIQFGVEDVRPDP